LGKRERAGEKKGHYQQRMKHFCPRRLKIKRKRPELVQKTYTATLELRKRGVMVESWLNHEREKGNALSEKKRRRKKLLPAIPNSGRRYLRVHGDLKIRYRLAKQKLKVFHNLIA